MGKLNAILVGQTLLSVNGIPVNGGQMENGKEALEFLSDAANFPVRYFDLTETKHDDRVISFKNTCI